MKKDYFKNIYEICLCLLALTSIIIVIGDLSGYLRLDLYPYRQIDLLILAIFWIDYLLRFYLATKKSDFFKKNILDLLAILPFNEMFSLFRVARLFRLTKLARLTKIIRITKFVKVFAFFNIFKSKSKKFLHTNGFIYVLYCSVILIFTSSCIMSYLEKQSFWDSLWWSIVTCTTLGYGDIAPTTSIGRIVAVILMVFGIGFIGMLTGTITTYFSQQGRIAESIDQELKSELDSLNSEQKIAILKKIRTFKELEKELQHEIWS